MNVREKIDYMIQCLKVAKAEYDYMADYIANEPTERQELGNIYWCDPFYSFGRNEIKRELRDHKYRILITATFPKDMPQEKVRKIMCDRVAKWKAGKECL